jgi:hypothetical protein
MSLSSRIKHGRSSETIVTAAVTGAVLFLPALKCLLGNPTGDWDVWWHLKTGEWIVEHGALPVADTFSSVGLGQPWTAYSWVPELILYGLYQVLGLRGLLLYTAGLSVAIVVAFLRLLRRFRPVGSLDLILVLAATLGLIPVMTPRPWLFSILFFVIELDLLLTATRSGNRRLLLWLVPLFVLWANCHIQFILGLVVLGIAAAEPLLDRLVSTRLPLQQSNRIPFQWMILIVMLCFAATLINPYHVRLYFVAAHLVGQSHLWNVIQELEAMPFRSACNWVVLAATLVAAFAMGWRRKIRIFLVVLFAMSIYFGFRAQRDAWFPLLVGLTVVAHCSPKEQVRRRGAHKAVRRIVPMAVILAVFIACFVTPEARLREKINSTFPAKAANFIARGEFSGPLFNDFAWGGYLILHLPCHPVNIDGRTMIHGQERIVRHSRTLRGEEGWQDDPELSDAELVVLPRSVTLTGLLKMDQRFCLMYQDSVAAVFRRSHT